MKNDQKDIVNIIKDYQGDIFLMVMFTMPVEYQKIEKNSFLEKLEDVPDCTVDYFIDDQGMKLILGF